MKRMVLVGALAMALVGCGVQPTAPALGGKAGQALTVSGKKDTANSKLPGAVVKDKASRGNKKVAKDLKITNTKFRQDLTADQLRSLANSTLAAADAADTWENGYKIAMSGLARLNTTQGGRNLAVKMGYNGANATKTWADGYRITIAALDHLRSENNADQGAYLFAMALRGLDATKSWEDGYRAGMEMLKVLRTDHPSEFVRTMADATFEQADATTTWEDGYKSIISGLKELHAQSGNLNGPAKQ